MTEPFAPSLQLPWSLVSVRAGSFDRITVCLGSRERTPSPEPLGRHVSAIMADAEIISESATAEFAFDHVVLFRMCREGALPELGDETFRYRGETFRWCLQSHLLQAQRDRWPEGSEHAAKLLHYQLVCGEVIDVICHSAPRVLFRHP